MSDPLTFALEANRAAGFERALLGTLLAYPSLFEKAEDLMPSDFVDPGHQAIFSQMQVLYRQDQLSARAVVENMRARGELNTIDMREDGEAYIRELTTYASAPSVDNFLKNVIQAAMRRQILNASALMAADANQYDVDPDKILDDAEERILNLRRRTSDTGVDAANLMDMFETQYEARLDGSYVPALYPKVQALQDVIGAYEEQDFPIIAARPGQGKSSYHALGSVPGSACGAADVHRQPGERGDGVRPLDGRHAHADRRRPTAHAARVVGRPAPGRERCDRRAERLAAQDHHPGQPDCARSDPRHPARDPGRRQIWLGRLHPEDLQRRATTA